MSQINMTSEQLEVVEAKNKNLIISAQAGAGKTAVLVEKVVGEILEDDPNVEKKRGLDRLLIVTFTKKAANSLKEKIRARLISMLRDEDDPGRRKIILRQLGLIPSAHIQTLHAFCYEIIRSYYVYLAMDPAFHIADSKVLKQIQDKALDDCLNRAYLSDDGDLLEFIELYGLNARKNDQPLRELILKMSEEMSQKEDPETWLEESIQRISTEEYSIETVQGIKDKVIERALKSYLSAYRSFLQRARQALPDKYALSIENEPGDFAQAIEEAMDGNTDKLRAFKSPRASSISEKEYGPEVVSIKDRFNEERKRIKDSVKGITEFCLNFTTEKLEKENLLMQKYLEILATLVMDYRKNLQKRKADIGAIDFNDIEHLMLRLMENKEALDKLKNQFLSIYFDEYQDASEIQNIIIEKLAGKDNLFFVGDVKQSIYGFRQARPDNFLKRVDRYKTEKSRGGASDAMFLTYNFRSEYNILNFVNICFDRLMTEDRGGLVYNSPEQRARCGKLEFGDRAEKKGQVKFVLLDTDEPDEDPEGEQNQEDFKEGRDYINEKSPEAFYLARSIKEYLYESPDHKYSDIVVLFRKNKAIAEFDYVLNYFGIPTYVDSDKSYMDSIEKDLAINLLKVVDRGNEDIALLSILSSKVGDFSDGDLASIRAFYPKSSFSAAFNNMVEGGEFRGRDKINPELLASYEEIRDKVEAFQERITAWRRDLNTMPLENFVSKLFDESGLYDFSASLDHGSERRQNLDLLLRVAQQYEAEGGADLFGLISRLEEDESSSGQDMKPAGELSEADNVVRLMTIHASKGLDSEVIYIVDLSASFFGKTRSPYDISADMGPALAIREIDRDSGAPVQYPSYRLNFQKDYQISKEIDEEVRIFYTAMTRPKSRLIMIGHSNRVDQLLDRDAHISRDELENRLANSKSFLEWLANIVNSLEKLPEGFELFVESADKYRPWDGKIGQDEDRDLPEEDKEVEPYLAGRVLGYRYEHGPASRAPIKESVSRLAKGIIASYVQLPDRDENIDPIERESDLKIPEFMSGERPLTGAEMGSLLHYSLQVLPIRPYEPDELKKELDELIEKNILDETEVKALDTGLLLKFYNSDLGKTLCKLGDRVIREKAFSYRIKYKDLPKTFPEELRNGEFSDLYVTVDGRVDLFAELSPEEGGGLLLLDFKSDRKMNSDHYRAQIDLYRAALEAAYGKPVTHAYLYWLRFGRLESI